MTLIRRRESFAAELLPCSPSGDFHGKNLHLRHDSAIPGRISHFQASSPRNTSFAAAVPTPYLESRDRSKIYGDAIAANFGGINRAYCSAPPQMIHSLPIGDRRGIVRGPTRREYG